MICSQCKRETVSKRANCFYCGGRLIFEEKIEQSLQCPGCRSFMKKVERAGITVDECPSCKGSWYDRSELEQLLRKSKSDLHPTVVEDEIQEQPTQDSPGWPRASKSKFQQPVKGGAFSRRKTQKTPSTPFNSAYRKCPHCSDMMNSNNYLKSGIIVDVCRKHGIYLDHGEFEDLHQFILHNPIGF